jgi:hypothetical protein
MIGPAKKSSKLHQKSLSETKYLVDRYEQKLFPALQ